MTHSNRCFNEDSSLSSSNHLLTCVNFQYQCYNIHWKYSCFACFRWNQFPVQKTRTWYDFFYILSVFFNVYTQNYFVQSKHILDPKIKIDCAHTGTLSSLWQKENFLSLQKLTQKNIFEILLNQIKIRLYLPFSD